MIAPAPEPDFEKSITYFNSFSALGRTLSNDKDGELITMLFDEVERYKGVGHAEYYAMKSAYCSLVGDIRGLQVCCTNVKAHTSNDQYICFTAQSLIFSGQFTKAYELLTTSRINWNEPGSIAIRLIELVRSHSHSKLIKYLALLAKCKVEVSEKVNAMADTFRRAQELKIPEVGVRNMLDAAGKIVRERGYTIDKQAVDVIGSSLVVSIAIKAPPAVVARMEWDYTGVLVEDYPEAPVHNVSVVFFSEEDA